MYATSSILGQVFGRLTPLEILHNPRRVRSRCACGNEIISAISHLVKGHIKSCGCLHREAIGSRVKIHGFSGTPTGNSWSAMLKRCYSKKSHGFHRYGGRGILVCEFLRASPVNLVMLIGERPPGKSLDREDNNGHYSCGACAECLQKSWALNVRWVNAKTQGSNRHNNVWIEHNGERKIASEWARVLGVHPGTVLHKYKNGEALI